MENNFTNPPPPIKPIRGNSLVNTSNFFRKPDYKKFAQLMEWSESVAAALCCDFDYQAIRGLLESSSIFKDSPGSEYLHLKNVFNAALMAKAPNAYWHRLGSNGERMVKPALYLKWAISMGFSPPPELIYEVNEILKKTSAATATNSGSVDTETLNRKIELLEKEVALLNQENTALKSNPYLQMSHENRKAEIKKRYSEFTAQAPSTATQNFMTE
jgi:hypothetical protein